MSDIAPRDRLIVALDFPSVEEARELVTALGDTVTFYKIGLELVLRGGLGLAEDLNNAGRNVFLDLKLLDIGNTVERAVESAAATGARFLTIHGTDTKTMKAATAGRAGTDLRILAVTVLTNLDQADLHEQGIERSPGELVLHRAKLAHAAGCDGVIASGLEAAQVRQATGSDFLIVTPGIRMPDGEAGDQARVATPASAIRDGADFLVVGRPITQARDPAAAARAFTKEITAAS
jgi:orotidine-5'-phosphate decarboxylase